MWLSMTRFRSGQKTKAGTQVWCSRSTDGLPNHQIAPLLLDTFASYSGPDKGLAVVPDLPVVQPGMWTVSCLLVISQISIGKKVTSYIPG